MKTAVMKIDSSCRVHIIFEVYIFACLHQRPNELDREFVGRRIILLKLLCLGTLVESGKDLCMEARQFSEQIPLTQAFSRGCAIHIPPMTVTLLYSE